MTSQYPSESKAPFMALMDVDTAYCRPGHSQDSRSSFAPLTPRPNATSIRSKFRELTNKWWLGEVGAIVLAFVLFFVLVALLGILDGTSYSGKAYKTANIYPIVSLIDTVMKAAILMPVASALGQLKWSWFKERRHLVDIETFDEASRGVLGSIRLLFTLRFWHLASVGAALTVITLGMDAVVQSSIRIQPRGYTNGTTSLPVAVDYTRFQRLSSGDVPGDQWAPTSVIMAIQFALSYNSGLSDMFSPEFLVPCPSGNCTFGRYQSLAVNYRCVERPVTTDSTGRFFLLSGTGMTLRKDTGRLMAVSTPSYPSAGIFADFGPLIIHTGLILNFGSSGPIGMQCVLYWAHDTINATVDYTTNYALKENVIESSFPAKRTTTYKQTKGIAWQPDECWINGTRNTNTFSNGSFIDSQCTFYVGPLAQLGLQNILMDDVYGLVGDAYAYSATNYSTTNHFATNVWEIASTNRTAMMLSIQYMWANTALLISKSIRTLPAPKGESPLTTKGIVNASELFYHVKWSRLAFPAAILVCTALFLLYTAVTARSDQVWKRSNLPLLFHGLGPREREEVSGISDYAEIREVSKNMVMKLNDETGRLQLVTARY